MTTKNKTYREEIKNRNIALIITIIFHVIILLLLIFFKIIGKTEVPEPPIYGLGMVGDIDGTDDENGGGKEIPIEEVIDNTEAGEESSEDIATNENSDITTENKNPGKTGGKTNEDNGGENPGGKKKGNGGVGDDLNLAGYEWAEEPDWKKINTVDNTASEEGEIVFKIQVDEEGFVMRVEIEKSTVSQRLALKFRDAIAKNAHFKPITGIAQGASGTLKIKIK